MVTDTGQVDGGDLVGEWGIGKREKGKLLLLWMYGVSCFWCLYPYFKQLAEP